LTAALEIALAPQVRVRAAEMAEEVRGDGAMVAAKWLVNTLSRP
jgi:vancomycin aglycone glucosyltransferase